LPGFSSYHRNWNFEYDNMIEHACILGCIPGAGQAIRAKTRKRLQIQESGKFV
jgi:hypothetical protein